jgi:hypothetical protein
MNEWSEFRQHNDRKKIIWMNERTNDRMIGRTNDRNFGSITAGQRLPGRTMNRDYERTMNDRMIERTNDRNFGSITVGKRLFGRTNGRTIERSDERTNEPWTIERTIGRSDERTNKLRTGDERSKNDRTILVLVCACVEHGMCVGERVAMKWLGVGWEEALAPLFIAMVGIRGMRGLVGD